MAQAVYSKRLLGGLVTPSAPLSYSVPSGFKAVAKSIAIVAQASGVTLADVTVNGAWVAVVIVSPALNQTNLYNLTLTLEPGDSIAANTAGNNSYIWVSGYELALP